MFAQPPVIILSFRVVFHPSFCPIEMNGGMLAYCDVTSTRQTDGSCHSWQTTIIEREAQIIFNHAIIFVHTWLWLSEIFLNFKQRIRECFSLYLSISTTASATEQYNVNGTECSYTITAHLLFSHNIQIYVHVTSKYHIFFFNDQYMGNCIGIDQPKDHCRGHITETNQKLPLMSIGKIGRSYTVHLFANVTVQKKYVYLMHLMRGKKKHSRCSVCLSGEGQQFSTRMTATLRLIALVKRN